MSTAWEERFTLCLLVSLHLPTRDLKPVRLQTLSPVGNLSFTYVGRRLFTFLDLLTFLGAIIGGYFLVARFGFPPLKVTSALVVVPLVAAWFTSSAIAEIYNSCFAGGIVLCVFLVAMAATRQVTTSITCSPRWMAGEPQLFPPPLLGYRIEPPSEGGV